ncbi:hypothetical protein ACQEVF_23825 [Nonomuraea polychroma]|uniref:hypothetical protein n=1 Tax=Nonomuraea polychroma TaxID=46176 RepID=UPI003D9402E0
MDIPRTPQSTIENVRVRERGRSYSEEGTPEVGVNGPAGTFAQKSCEAAGAHRVVWYFDADAESITATATNVPKGTSIALGLAFAPEQVRKAPRHRCGHRHERAGRAEPGRPG